ncbi:hypothetical protein WISP_145729 [Willisornis vidua]|uniref:Uncharacterized protein n=1 Tax=Willisornis vidua TaxID=1566151 RepID=A0ABQ9CKX0_9PASS|nr:hypothetical protein WISP_145729 [Willisornis vidua]
MCLIPSTLRRKILLHPTSGAIPIDLQEEDPSSTQPLTLRSHPIDLQEEDPSFTQPLTLRSHPIDLQEEDPSSTQPLTLRTHHLITSLFSGVELQDQL